LSKQEVIRRAVLDRHARAEHRRRIDELADEMLEQYGDALDRLGKV
jgi:predicted small metal-binding protein